MVATEDLGFILNRKKSQLIPSQEIEFLGQFGHLVPQTRRLGNQGEVPMTAELALHLRGRSHSPDRPTKFDHSRSTPCPPALQSSTAVEEPGGHPQRRQVRNRVHCGSTADLKWWVDHLDHHNGRPITLPSGWGAHCNGSQTGGPWSIQEATAHINIVLLKACFPGLQTFASDMMSCHVLLLMDNQTAVSFLNKKSETHLKDLACDIWQWHLLRTLTIYAQY